MSSPSPRRRGAVRFTVCTVATALACTLVAPLPATAAPRTLSASDVLESTTAAERRALAAAIELSMPAEVQVADSLDLTSGEALDVIVTLRQPVAATAVAVAEATGEELTEKDAAKAAKAAQKRFLAHAEGKGLGKGITARYSDAINAIALTATGPEIASLLDSADVAGVWPNETITLALPTVADDAPLTGGGVTYDETAALHAEGITGEGIKIGVLDTGIDYNHPALKDVYVGGYDAVDGDDDPMETTYADWQASGRAEKVNGSPYYTSHGTHVAGIIAGQDDFGGRASWGVAPDAEIYGYRVLGPYGGGSTEDILEGMEHALADGMDIVNMSLGGSINDHRAPLSIAADNLTLAGVTTVIAAGNDGDAGAATLGSPGASALAITVGANDSPLELAATDATVGGASADLRLLAQARDDASVTALAGQTYPIVDVGDGTWRGYSGKNPRDAIVLIERGGTTFHEMVDYARRRGAVGALVVNNRDDGHIQYYLGEDDAYIPAFSVTAAEGATLRAAMADGSAEVTFGEMTTATTEGETLASFSSRGPAKGTTDIKPEITAPGVSVMSSVPTWDIDPTADIAYDEAYARKSGTSMATPFVAGLAALMLDADPSLTPADVKTRLMNTADDLRDDSGVFESGAGQVDPFEAVHGTVDAQVQDDLWVAAQRGNSTQIDDITGALAMGMLPSTQATTVTKTVEITNRGDRSATYAVALDTAHGAGTVDLASSGVRVDLPGKVKVQAGATKKVKVSVTVPAGAADGTYGAFVTISGAPGEEPVRLPLGFRVDDAEIFDFTMLKQIMSTGDDTYDPALRFSLGVATPTRSLDLFLVDPDSGSDLGYLGSIDPSLMQDGLRYGPFAWYGEYLPLTSDKDFPISHKTVTVEPGLHALRAVGTDDAGTRFSTPVEKFYVDNTAPVFTTNFTEDGGDAYGTDSVNEFTQGQSTFALSGSVIDGELDAIRAAGIDIDQSANRVQLFSTTINPYLQVNTDADGSFARDIELTFGSVQSHRFLGVDAAGNIGSRVETMWFKDTQAYVVAEADREAARPGETVTTSLSTNNANSFAEMSVHAYFNKRDIAEIRAVAQEPFAQYGRIDGEPTVVQTSTNIWRWEQKIVFDGAKEYTGDALPLIDLLYDVPDTIAAANTGFMSVSTYVTDTNGRGVSMQRAFDPVAALSPNGIAAGGYYAQGLFVDGAPNGDVDHSDVGATATLTATDGRVVDLAIDENGAIDDRTVPLSADPWMLTVSVPGHLTWYEPLALSAAGPDGEPVGALDTFSAQLAAGDVNGDELVDILDAIAIRDAKGTDHRAADINADGTVDAADLAFVELNFLVRNPTADTVPAPQAKHKGVSLDEVLAAFAG